MKHCYALMIPLLLVLTQASGQLSRQRFSNNVTFSLYSPVSDNPGIELGYERRYGRWSTLGSYTFCKDLFGVLKTDSIPVLDYAGYRIFPRRWDYKKEETRVALAAPVNLRIGFNF